MRVIEKQLEDEEELEKNLNKDDKKKNFQDEDAIDSDEERKKKEEEKKATQATTAGEGKKKQVNKKDYDKMFEERLKANRPQGSTAAQARIEEIQKSNLSREAKQQ